MNLQDEVVCATTRGHDETPRDDHESVKGEEEPAEEEQEGVVMKPEQEQVPERAVEEGRHAVQRQHYAVLAFTEKRPVPPPPSDMLVVAYAEVGQA